MGRMAINIPRRKLITLLGGAAAAWLYKIKGSHLSTTETVGDLFVR
jgi:hypothetical protein